MTETAGLQAFKKLLAEGGLPELGPGPRAGILPHAVLNENLDELLTNTTLPSVSRDLIRGIILLWHDRLDAAHEIAQGIENVDGSLLHGIVHRRESDYGNAMYWFRRVGGHPSFPTLATRVEEILTGANARSLKAELIPDGEWDPFAFIRLCEKAASLKSSEPQVNLLRKVQGIESGVLLEHFFRL